MPHQEFTLLAIPTLASRPQHFKTQVNSNKNQEVDITRSFSFIFPWYLAHCSGARNLLLLPAEATQHNILHSCFLLASLFLKTLSYHPGIKRSSSSLTTCQPFSSSHQSCCYCTRSVLPFNLFLVLTQCDEICGEQCDNSMFNKIYRVGAATHSVIH